MEGTRPGAHTRQTEVPCASSPHTRHVLTTKPPPPKRGEDVTPSPYRLKSRVTPRRPRGSRGKVLRINYPLFPPTLSGRRAYSNVSTIPTPTLCVGHGSRSENQRWGLPEGPCV